jgi:hypothetical protein
MCIRFLEQHRTGHSWLIVLVVGLSEDSVGSSPHVAMVVNLLIPDRIRKIAFEDINPI